MGRGNKQTVHNSVSLCIFHFRLSRSSRQTRSVTQLQSHLNTNDAVSVKLHSHNNDTEI